MEPDTKQRFLDLCCEAAYCETSARIDEIADELLHLLKQESRKLNRAKARQATASE